MARKTVAPERRFWALVHQPCVDQSCCPPGPHHECWRWGGAIAADTGYGLFNSGAGKTILAHIFSFETTRAGLDRTGLVVRHTCDNPMCVNPSHLRLGTRADNTRDMDERGRRVSNPRRGDAHTNSKLTLEVVQRCRMLHMEGRTVSSLAKAYGVSVTTMSSAISGKTWRMIK